LRRPLPRLSVEDRGVWKRTSQLTSATIPASNQVSTGGDEDRHAEINFVQSDRSFRRWCRCARQLGPWKPNRAAKMRPSATSRQWTADAFTQKPSLGGQAAILSLFRA
jgi:hypothetical protein